VVEFAEQLRHRGMTAVEAVKEATLLRLRPILMTSFAFLLGILPLVFASGAGANGRHSMGTALFGGLLLSTVLNLFFTPGLYLIMQRVRERVRRKPAPAAPAAPRTEAAAHPRPTGVADRDGRGVPGLRGGAGRPVGARPIRRWRNGIAHRHGGRAGHAGRGTGACAGAQLRRAGGGGRGAARGSAGHRGARSFDAHT